MIKDVCTGPARQATGEAPDVYTFVGDAACAYRKVFSIPGKGRKRLGGQRMSSRTASTKMTDDLTSAKQKVKLEPEEGQSGLH